MSVIMLNQYQPMIVRVMIVAAGAQMTMFDDFDATVKFAAFGMHNCEEGGRFKHDDCMHVTVIACTTILGVV